MQHYFAPGSRAVTTDWMLRELDVPHERIVVDVAAGEQKEAAYRAINPMGKVPALVDGDVVVTETAAICAYLADRFPERGLAPAPGAPERGRYYRYLFFPGVSLEPAVSVAALGLEVTRPESVGWGDLPRVQGAVEAMAPDEPWVLGERFSAADVVFGGALAFFHGLGMLEISPRVERYVERVTSRPAYRASHSRAAGGA